MGVDPCVERCDAQGPAPPDHTRAIEFESREKQVEVMVRPLSRWTPFKAARRVSTVSPKLKSITPLLVGTHQVSRFKERVELVRREIENLRKISHKPEQRETGSDASPTTDRPGSQKAIDEAPNQADHQGKHDDYTD